MPVNQYQQDVGKLAEDEFKRLCDKMGLPWLYISQDSQNISSKLLYGENGKRPDFLLSIPDVASIFIDVKARDVIGFYKGYSLEAVELDKSDFDKLEKLQEKTLIPVWLVFALHIDRKLTGRCLSIPLTLIHRFILSKHVTGAWPKIRIPVQCFGEVSGKIEFKTNCELCRNKTCERVRKEFETIC